MVRTRTSRLLGVGSNGVVNAEPTPTRLAVLIRPPSSPSLGFMLAAPGGDEISLRIEGLTPKSLVQPWRVRQAKDEVQLLEPTHRTVLAERHDGLLEIRTGENAGSAGFFHLEPLSAASITPVHNEILQRLAAVLPQNLNGPDILDVIETSLTLDTADMLQAILRLLPMDQLDWVGRTVVGLPTHLARLALAYPDDLWATTVLPSLRAWLGTRERKSIINVGTELDLLAIAGLDSQPTTAAHALSAAARVNVPPRRRVCIVTTARNEGIYLVEWVAYHRSLGFDAIFIYSNDNTDGSEDILRALAVAGKITWIESKIGAGVAPQMKAYGHAFGVIPDVLDYRWSLVIDLDEYFAFDKESFNSLADYIDWQETQRVDAISLNWLVFGSGKATRWSPIPLVERFKEPLPWADLHIKSMSRTNLCLQSLPHHAVFQSQHVALTRDSEGVPYRWQGGFYFSEVPKTKLAWISHYFMKSAQEFLWKFSRQRGDASTKGDGMLLLDETLTSTFVFQHNHPSMPDDMRTLRCVPKLHFEIERLRALPGVRAAETRTIARFQQRMNLLIKNVQAVVHEPDCPPSVSQLAILCQ